MRFLVLIFFSLFCVNPIWANQQAVQPAQGTSALLGLWDYVAFFYQDHRYVKPNPALHVTFDFETETEVRLKWIRDEDNSLCERLATYHVKDNILFQKVTWVNPDNSFECGKDPDMVMGSESETKFEIKDDELNLYLGLNGEDFIYILKRVSLSH